MANPDGVNVHQRAKKLVHVQLNLQHRHRLLQLGIVATGAINSFGYVFEHKIEVYFVFLWWMSASVCDRSNTLRLAAAAKQRSHNGRQKTHLVPVRVEESSKIDDVWMRDESHDLEFTVLEPLVLQDLLDRNVGVGGIVEQFCLEDDTE